MDCDPFSRGTIAAKAAAATAAAAIFQSQ